AEQTLEFFFPLQLTFHYTIPLQRSVTWISLLSLFWLLVFGVALLRSKAPARTFWIGCIVFPYLFTFFPFPQKSVKQDAFSVLPLLGFIALTGFWVSKKTSARLWFRLVSLFILGSFFLLSWNRVQSWKEPQIAWERAAQSTKGGSVAQYELGLYYLEEGQKESNLQPVPAQEFFKRAKQTFEGALKNKLDEEIQFSCCIKLGLLSIHDGQDIEALSYLKRAEELTQQEKREVFLKDKRYYLYQNQAQIYDRQGNSRLAQSYWKKLISSYPEEIQPRYSLAISQNQFGSPQEAINTLIDLLVLDEKYYLARLQIGKIHFNLKEYALAKQQFIRVLEYSMPPQDEREALYNLALTYHSLREYGEEEFCLKRLTALAPELWLAHRDLARLEKKKGNTDEAIRLLLIALQNLEQSKETNRDTIAQMKQDISDLYLLKGKLAGEREDYSKARFWIEKAIDIVPENWRALYEEAFLEKRQGSLSLAKEKFEQLLQRNTSYYEAFRELGHIALQQKKKPEAVAYFQKYLEKVPLDKIELRAHLEEIIWNYKAEQYREAVRASIPAELLQKNALSVEVDALKKALLSSPPEDQEVQTRLERFITQSEIRLTIEESQICIREKQWENALQALNRLLQRDPENWEAYLLKGLVCIEINSADRETIEDTLLKAIHYNPEHPQAYYILGTYYFDLGERDNSNPEQSKQWFRQARNWLVLCKTKDQNKFYSSQIQGYLETLAQK
ncbi:MAG: tetratricopeptide repeat protein, partial [Planctomycetota bacterium]